MAAAAPAPAPIAPHDLDAAKMKLDNAAAPVVATEEATPFVHPTDMLPNQHWPKTQDLSGGGMPRRFQGTIFDLVVLGTIPNEVRGTFYRILPDPVVPPTYYDSGNRNVPIDGDGTIAAFRIENGHVDYRQRYVETDRLILEMGARKSLFGLYRNPYTYHPCVRNAVDSTANTNIAVHAGKFFAMKESAQAYELDPHTLETKGYNPFNLPSKTMTAHPKLDAVTGNLVGFGYEAKGLASKDIYFFELDKQGEIVNDLWFEGKGCYFIHDCALTQNYLCLMVWPFESNLERMKQGGHHWFYNYEQPVYWYVIPRKAKSASEVKIFYWENGMPIHTSSGYEDKSGNIIIDSSLVHGNAFPFFPPDDPEQVKMAATLPPPKAQFVRWTIDPKSDPAQKLSAPEVVLDVPSEFPQIDNRFMGKEFSSAFINVFMPEKSDGGKNVFQGLNGLAHYQRKKQGKVEWYYAGDNCLIQEPVFCPRSPDADEGDGFVLALVDRLDVNRNEVVVIDTRNFSKPVAVIQLPFAIRSGIHGQWIDASVIPDFDSKSQIDVPQAKLRTKPEETAFSLVQ